MGPVTPQITMMRTAPAKIHALPSTVDERRAKIRKTSLTTQKKSLDSPCSLSFSFCISIERSDRRRLKGGPLTQGLLESKESIQDLRWANSPNRNYMARQVALRSAAGLG